MRCQGCVQPGVAPMPTPEPARVSAHQHTGCVGDVVGNQSIDLQLIDPIELRRTGMAAVGAAATDELTQHNVSSGMAAVDKRQTDDREGGFEGELNSTGGFPWANFLSIRHDF